MKKEKIKINIEKNVSKDAFTYYQKNNAITLISLIITIIILLILTGVTVNVLIGDDGLINKTKEAVIAQKKAQYFEEINIAIVEEQTERIVTAKEEELILSLKKKIQSKNWTSEENVIMCKETENGFEQKENIIDNNILLIETNDNYEIIVEVNNITLEAKIRENYFEKVGNKLTLTLDPNGGNGNKEEKEVRRNFKVILNEPNYSKNGYEFAGWSENKNGEGIRYLAGSEYKVEKSVRLYAIWERNVATIILDSNDGTSRTIELSVAKNVETVLPTNNLFTREGYALAKWNTNADGTGTEYGKGAKITINEDITLYAEWEVKVTGTLNFKVNDVSGVKKLTEGTKITIGATALSSGIQKIELSMGNVVVYEEEPNGNKTYTKEIEINQLKGLEKLRVSNKYEAKLKVTSINNNSEEITENDIENYTIGSALSLGMFSNSVENGNSFEGETIYQVNDITGINYSIGNETTPFKGTYNGGNHQIGVNISSDADYVGLFNYVEGTIKNLTITGSVTKTAKESTKSHVFAGGVVGYIKGKINNCINNATVIGSQQKTSCLLVGGIAGEIDGEGIETCTNNGNVTMSISNGASGGVAGIVGGNGNGTIIRGSNNKGSISLNATTAKGTYTGGIIGYNNGEVKNCTNNGKINTSLNSGSGNASHNYDHYFTGGVVGYSIGIVQSCTNENEVIVTSINVPKDICIGGVAGYNEKDTLSCTNNGKVTKNDNGSSVKGTGIVIGGVVGWQNGSKIENCKNTAVISGDSVMSESVWVGGVLGSTWDPTIVSKCSNTAEISAYAELYQTIIYKNDTEHLDVGGIAGNLYNGSTMSECYNIGPVTGTVKCNNKNKYVVSGGIVGYNYGAVSDCYNKASVYALNEDITSSMCAGGIAGCMKDGTISNTYNTSLDIGRSSLAQYKKPVNEFKGLIVGYSDGTTSNSYYISSSKNSTYYAINGIASGNTSGTTSKTASQLKGLASTLGSTYWSQSSTKNEEYPYLKNNQTDL